jgi:hypothetical protein
VAPSGSSKTRARREAEAKEKRKKLSEAALKAVSIAGGDVEAVKKAILAWSGKIANFCNLEHAYMFEGWRYEMMLLG